MILHQNSQPTPSPPPRSDVSTDEALLPVMTCYCGHTQEAIRWWPCLSGRSGSTRMRCLPAPSSSGRPHPFFTHLNPL